MATLALTAGLVLGAALASTPVAAQGPLSRTEQRIRKAAAEQVDDQIGYLQRVVDMPSSTLDLDGVRAVGGVFARSLDSLGFETRWAEMPAEMRRAGHLVAEHRGKRGKARLLLIGHLDTVVDPDRPTFARRDSVADGIGGSDMKGGDVVVLYALRALAAAGALRDLNVTVVFTGDEEHAGSPLELSRRDLIEAARRSDLALGFESGRPSDLTVARRGAASWRADDDRHRGPLGRYLPGRHRLRGDLRAGADPGRVPPGTVGHPVPELQRGDGARGHQPCI